MGNESKSSFDDGESDENEEDRKLLSCHKPSERQNRIKFGPTQSFRVKSDRDHNDKVNIYESILVWVTIYVLFFILSNTIFYI